MRLQTKGMDLCKVTLVTFVPEIPLRAREWSRPVQSYPIPKNPKFQTFFFEKENGGVLSGGQRHSDQVFKEVTELSDTKQQKVIIVQSNQMVDCQEQRRRMRATLAGKYVHMCTYGKGSQKRRIQATLFSSNPIVHCPPDPQRPIRPLRFCCRSPWRTVLD